MEDKKIKFMEIVNEIRIKNGLRPIVDVCAFEKDRGNCMGDGEIDHFLKMHDEILATKRSDSEPN